MNQENQGYGVPVQSQQPMQQPVQQPFTQPMMQQPAGFGTPVMPNQQPKKKKIG